MDKVNYAIVLCSKTYQGLICSTLSKNDVMFTESVQTEDICLHEYVKQNAASLGNYDAFIIDFGSLMDTDEEIIDALEMLRFYDDKMRIIILEGTRMDSYRLLHQCFLNGIYNLIVAGSFIDVRSNLEKCILKGMTYKEALPFRSEEETKKTEKAQVRLQKRTVIFCGTQNRIGVTHCVIAAAYTLRSCGYIVAVMDCTGGRDYLSLMQCYDLQMNEEGYFSLDDIDFYVKKDQAFLSDNGYNFILYDKGIDCCSEIAADETIIVCGSKPWEIPFLSQAVSAMEELEKKSNKYLFNMADVKMVPDLRKMMKEVGVEEKNIFFMESLDLFQPSKIMRDVLEIQEVKKKKVFFRRRKG